MKKITKILSNLIMLSLIIVLPINTLAYSSGNTPTGNEFGTGNLQIENALNKVLTPLWQIAVGLTVIMVIVSAFLFITASGDPGKLSTARAALLWAIVGLVVAVIAFSVDSIVATFI